MKSQVKELQKDIIDNILPTSIILKKALKIASVLKQENFEEWIKHESKGYYDMKIPLPEYRVVRGQLKYFDGNGEWSLIDLGFKSMEEEEKMSKMFLAQDSVTLESWAANIGEAFRMSVPQFIENKFNEMMRLNVRLCFEFPTYQLKTILNDIKQIVYEWLLKLESDDILGKENHFTQEEINNSKTIIINNNFYGSVNNSQFNINSSDSKIIK